MSAVLDSRRNVIRWKHVPSGKGNGAIRVYIGKGQTRREAKAYLTMRYNKEPRTLYYDARTGYAVFW